MMQTVTAINAVIIRCSVDESESLGLMAILQVFVGLGHPWYPLLTHGSQLAIMGLVYTLVTKLCNLRATESLVEEWATTLPFYIINCLFYDACVLLLLRDGFL
jgi:hypothetical protein